MKRKVVLSELNLVQVIIFEDMTEFRRSEADRKAADRFALSFAIHCLYFSSTSLLHSFHSYITNNVISDSHAKSQIHFTHALSSQPRDTSLRPQRCPVKCKPLPSTPPLTQSKPPAATPPTSPPPTSAATAVKTSLCHVVLRSVAFTADTGC